MAKFYTATKTIGNREYTCQFNGISAALDAVDSTYIEGTSNTSVKKMAKYLLENVVVEPKGLTPDDFEDMEEFNEVIAFARQVMQGEFRNEKNAGAAKEKSTK